MDNVCEVIVMGAQGRMGSTLAGLVKADPDLNLAAAVERPEKVGGLETLGCVVTSDLDSILPRKAGAVIIDFTAPGASVGMVRVARRHGNPAVIGTTGLDSQQLAELEDAARDIPLFWAPNMSVGVNVLLQVLPDLVQKLGEAYDLEMVEMHHNKKADAPSGTAIKLAQCLARARGLDYDKARKYCREGIIGPRTSGEIGVQTLRGGDVVGEHTVYFLGPGERIEVTHRAHSRQTFAQGALRAAKWLKGQKPGRLYGMSDLF
ncbi:MAG: 4-hydroxy-tetrahydrodipicolinate reductase [Desulfovibrionaceae bacterium]|nr:4-hydroxy-tetrahydrodipicolinate reductase [Desulfovibrionaceae bacterium]MDD4951224.1 4-hydroxy-tetrahydrodipicolinate reductase [Desulfovibrionaceae bacterium]